MLGIAGEPQATSRDTISCLSFGTYVLLLCLGGQEEEEEGVCVRGREGVVRAGGGATCSAHTGASCCFQRCYQLAGCCTNTCAQLGQQAHTHLGECAKASRGGVCIVAHCCAPSITRSHRQLCAVSLLSTLTALEVELVLNAGKIHSKGRQCARQRGHLSHVCECFQKAAGAEVSCSPPQAATPLHDPTPQVPSTPHARSALPPPPHQPH